MKSKYALRLLILSAIFAIAGCSRSGDAPVPRPRGFFRIQLPDSITQNIPTPWGMNLTLNSHARVTYPGDSIATNPDSKWLNIDYPALNATVYCTYYSTPVRTKLLDAIQNRTERIALNARGGKFPQTVLFIDSISGVTHQVFFSELHNVVPFQFLTTDSATFLFSGAAYFHGNMNPDSIAPAIDILETDLLSMLQNLKLNGNNH